MKKYISLFLAVILAVTSLSSCKALDALEALEELEQLEDSSENKETEEVQDTGSSEDKTTIPLTLEHPAEIEAVARLSLVKVSTESKVRGSMGGGVYYENGTSGNVYIDAVFSAVNLSTENKKPDEIFKAYALNDEGKKLSSVLYCIETDGNTSVSNADPLLPMSEYRLHAAFSVPKTETELTLCFEIGDAMYIYKYTQGNKDMIDRPLNAGGNLKIEEFGRLEYLGYEFTKMLKPSNTSGAYSYYNCETEGNTYLVLNFDLINYGTAGIPAESFVSVRAMFDGKYEYTGFVSREKTDRKGFSTFDEIAPLESATVVGVIEIPESLMETPFEISVMFNNTEYTIVS